MLFVHFSFLTLSFIFSLLLFVFFRLSIFTFAFSQTIFQTNLCVLVVLFFSICVVQLF